jgi:hypothetical protein
MKKKFDVLKWIRDIRDENYKRERDLTPQEQIKQARSQAERFRASRHGKKRSFKK